MLKQRVAGDYLHTSSIIDKDFNVITAVNDMNDYMGPGTGYRAEGKRWEEIKKDSSQKWQNIKTNLANSWSSMKEDTITKAWYMAIKKQL